MESLTASDYVDVLIVGAGISGIGAAYHLKEHCPDRTFAIVEGRENLGGTWDLFRYPGVRSDSDMHTLGFRFKPWKADKCIADGPSILSYLVETVEENDLRRHIHFEHLATRAEWSSDNATWTVQVSHLGNTKIFRCGFLFMCSGYFSYKSGFTPEFPGRERFKGSVVHPQQWPENLDYGGKRVVVIGSGATAVTLIPAMADKTAHITMLQRSPTYVVARPDEDKINRLLRRVLPERAAYALTRQKNILFATKVYSKSREDPDKVRKLLLGGVRKALGPEFDVERHFTPSYNPWDQRLCLLPNGDLFEALNSGKASVVTDEIETFTETGIELRSGDVLPADIIVTATGLRMVTLGEMTIVVDGEPVDFSTTLTYKGMGYSGVPNLISTFGYINASWTLRADLVSDYVCRLLNHMRRTATVECRPTLRPDDRQMHQRPFVEEFSSGYMQRTMHKLPMQGDREPWVNSQRYLTDKKQIARANVDDGVMIFSGRPPLEQAG